MFGGDFILLRGRAVTDRTGQTFGRLTVVSLLPRNEWKTNNASWFTKCACGGSSVVNSSSLVSGSIQSCGCLRNENSSQRAKARTGANHPQWKGGSVGYSALHRWVERHKERLGVCSHCGEEARTHNANVSGEYKRDLSDWMELCQSCHHYYDRHHVLPGDR